MMCNGADELLRKAWTSGRFGSPWNGTWSAESAGVRPLSEGSAALCRDCSVVGYARRAAAGGPGALMSRPNAAVWKFALPNGYLVTLLDREDELLTIAEEGRTSPPSPSSARSPAVPTRGPLWRAPSPPPRTCGASSEIRAQSTPWSP